MKYTAIQLKCKGNKSSLNYKTLFPEGHCPRAPYAIINYFHSFVKIDKQELETCCLFTNRPHEDNQQHFQLIPLPDDERESKLFFLEDKEMTGKFFRIRIDDQNLRERFYEQLDKKYHSNKEQLLDDFLAKFVLATGHNDKRESQVLDGVCKIVNQFTKDNWIEKAKLMEKNVEYQGRSKVFKNLVSSSDEFDMGDFPKTMCQLWLDSSQIKFGSELPTEDFYINRTIEVDVGQVEVYQMSDNDDQFYALQLQRLNGKRF